jgi:hypothetical protein
MAGDDSRGRLGCGHGWSWRRREVEGVEGVEE